jgi:hypothetical protein
VKEGNMREIYRVENEPAPKGRMSILTAFFVSIDWNDPEAPILSSVWENGPWSETKATTKQYDQIGHFFTVQIDEQRSKKQSAKAKR